MVVSSNLVLSGRRHDGAAIPDPSSPVHHFQYDDSFAQVQVYPAEVDASLDFLLWLLRGLLVAK